MYVRKVTIVVQNFKVTFLVDPVLGIALSSEFSHVGKLSAVGNNELSVGTGLTPARAAITPPN